MGKKSEVGDTRTSPNGYHYTRTEERWRLTHHIVMEQKLGRSLVKAERVYFIDKDITNLDPSNLEVRVVQKTKEDRIAYLKAKIRCFTEELEELLQAQNS